MADFITDVRCPEKSCHVPLGICMAGAEHWTKCDLWRDGRSKEDSKSAKSPAAAVSVAEPPAAWSGCALGIDDLDVIAARAAPHLITILGPHNAGKTTLLAAWYLLLLRGARIPGRRFAGSASLEGWESLAYWLRWDLNFGPTFPPHTTMGQGRRPGLLHVAFRRETDGVLEDMLLTDAPGEWFERWAVQRDDPAAEGARWAVRHASVLVFVIDSDSLIGPDRGKARNQIVLLARRLRDEVADRPVHLIWTKADKEVGAELRAGLERDLAAHLPDAHRWRVSVQRREGHDTGADLIAPFAGTLPVKKNILHPALRIAARDTADPLLLYRGAA